MRSRTAPSISGQETSRKVDCLVNIIIITKHKTEPPASLHNMKSDSKSTSYFLLLFSGSQIHITLKIWLLDFFPQTAKVRSWKKR